MADSGNLLDSSVHVQTTTRCIPPQRSFYRWEKQWTEHSILHHFQRQVCRFPDRVVVKSRDQKLSYRQLDSAANRLAQAILARCGEEKQTVMLLLGKGSQIFVGMIGALKAAKSYVPLDPSYPTERNRLISEDLAARLVITDNDNVRLAECLVGNLHQLINVDELGAGDSDDDPNLSVQPDDTAFILYTSGSTGQPKGVVYTHRNVLHIVLRYTNGQQICSDDRLSLLLSHSYAASVGNIFGGLLNGATIYPFDVKEEGFYRMANWLGEEEITIYNSVPTLFRGLVDTLAEGQNFSSLRLIRLGGDTIHKTDVDSYKKFFHENCLLHVGLGTTETSVVRECFFDKETDCDSEIVPAGYAVEDMEVLILDDAGEPLGPGCVGEIAIRSPYVSSGYWNRPELTKIAFLSDPDGGDRLTYLTGDLGRLQPDGCLIHLGRKDSQLKVRGFRVEAAEVEAALLRVRGISGAVVTAQDDDSDEKRLVAHLILKDGTKLDAIGLRLALRHLLPDFMIPRAFVVVDEFPCTPAGKVDRSQLEYSSSAGVAIQSGLVGPRNPIESQLVELWEQVLGITPIGVKDDFFNLGGDSLAAVEMVTEIQALHGLRLEASALIQASTIEQLANLIVSGDAQHSTLVPIHSTGSKPPFFCVHGIGGDVISFRDLANHVGEDQPFYGLRADNGGTHRLSVESIAAHYIEHMKRLQPAGPYSIGGYSFGGMVAFEIAHQLTAKGETVAFLALFDTYGPGYPKLLPLRKRLMVHARTMVPLGAAARVEYLRERVQINLIRIKKNVRSFRYRISIAARGKLTDSILRNFEAAHQHALAKYSAIPYPGKLDLFRAVHQKEIWYPDPLLGWSGLALGGIRVHAIAGDHTSLIAEPNVRSLGNVLKECLARARGEANPILIENHQRSAE